MQLLIVYDINTTSADGKKRLRDVATICEGFGHRVQHSVFEADLDRAGLLRLEATLTATIDHDTDSIGIYRLLEPYDQHVRHHGARPTFDRHVPFNL